MVDLSILNAGYESVSAVGISAGDCSCFSDCYSACTCTCDCTCTCGDCTGEHSGNWDGPSNRTYGTNRCNEYASDRDSMKAAEES